MQINHMCKQITITMVFFNIHVVLSNVYNLCRILLDPSVLCELFTAFWALGINFARYRHGDRRHVLDVATNCGIDICEQMTKLL